MYRSAKYETLYLHEMQQMLLVSTTPWRTIKCNPLECVVGKLEAELFYASDSEAAATAAPNTELSRAISIEMAPRDWPLITASSSRKP